MAIKLTPNERPDRVATVENQGEFHGTLRKSDGFFTVSGLVARLERDTANVPRPPLNIDPSSYTIAWSDFSV